MRAAVHGWVVATGSVAAGVVSEDGLGREREGQKQGDELDPLFHALTQ